MKRKKTKKIFSFLILSLVSLKCSNSSITTEEMKEIVADDNERLGKFFITGNADNHVSMYTKDDVIAPQADDFYFGINS